MGKNELILRKQGELGAVNKQQIFQIVEYNMYEDSYCEFKYSDENIFVNMREDFQHESMESEFIDVEFDETVNLENKPYYIVAAASGFTTGFMSLACSAVWDIVSKEKVENNENVKKFVISIARIMGYKKKDYTGAINFIIKNSCNKLLRNSDIFDNNLSNHPYLAGFAFSLLTQYRNKKYIVKDGKIEDVILPKYYAIGRNNEEKIMYALLYWIFSLANTLAKEKIDSLDNLQLPKEIIALIKTLSKSSLFKSIPNNSCESEALFSKFIKMCFEETTIDDGTGHKILFDLKDIITDVTKKVTVDSVFIILNECVVRGFYFVKRLVEYANKHNIKSFDDIKNTDLDSVLPYNTRLVSRMVLISSGVFTAMNTSSAVLRIVMGKKIRGRHFAKALITEINIIGIGRFVYACKEDCKYWKEDIAVIFQRYKNNYANEKRYDFNEAYKQHVFEAFSLDALQSRLLYSLEAIAVEKDILKTVNNEELTNKIKWLHEWKKYILLGMGIKSMEYFINDEKVIYDWIVKFAEDKNNLCWLYLLTMEFSLFEPYYPLESEYDDKYRKLKVKYDYIRDQYIRRQTFTTQEEVDEIVKAYNKYKGIINGSAKNKVVGTGVALVTAAATGGAAFVFAPQIAVLIAGQAVATLHGAALTSASLAFVGGGALAAGGLGMAGGTAIIAGGGALLGLAGSGTVSMATYMMQTSEDSWVRQGAKMLAYSQVILKDMLNDENSIKNVYECILQTIVQVKDELSYIENENNDLNKEVIKRMKKYLKCITRCENQFKQLIK